jgi:hypothetical protein
LFSLLDSYFALKAETSTPFESYLFVGDPSRFPLYLSWNILIGMSVLVCSIMILSNFIRFRKLSFGEICIGSIIVTSTIIFFIYTSMGNNEISLLLTAGVLGYSSLTTSRSVLLRKFFILICLILIIEVIIMNLLAVSDNRYGGQTDRNNFQYLKHPALWYNMHHAPHMYKTYADQLTRGYFKKEAFLSGEPFTMNPFPKDIILSILEPESCSLVMIKKIKNEESNQYLFIFNYKQESSAIEKWIKIKSWSNYRNNINNNRYLNTIYSSGFIGICEQSSLMSPI